MKKDFFNSLFELIQKKEPVLLTTIISQHGSSPRGTGARIAITANGYQIGTIGGGKLEATLQERFEELIASGSATILDFVLSESEAACLEMICGGSLSVLVDPILPDQTELYDLFERISQTVESHQQGWLFSLLPMRGEIKPPEKCFITSTGEIWGNWLPLLEMKDNLPEKINFENIEIQLSELNLKVPQILKINHSRIFVEPIGQHSTVYIVGAGHIAQKLAPLTTLVGFHTIILDDRPDFISQERFPTVDQRILLDDFEQVFQNLVTDSPTFVVIVTRGHHFDKSVLKQALQIKTAYVGMIGSRRKIKLTVEALLNEGIKEEQLSKVYSPIGLKIGAETPEEIAISIVAELIQVRAQIG